MADIGLGSADSLRLGVPLLDVLESGSAVTCGLRDDLRADRDATGSARHR
jgi:hypothetical protein